MSGNNLYYIYIDTKIEGAVEQLVSYFQTHVFNADDCIYVLCKYYKDFYKQAENLFLQHDICFKWIKKKSDLTLIDGKVVFYLFNAQSNCGVTAHRKLTHIFVTHGESHKIASVKPILRIYDFVISSGQVGVDRLLKANIFSEADRYNNKIIQMGNTFIGQNSYEYCENSNYLLYAPTWEGGLPDENHSSIDPFTSRLLIDIAREYGIQNIVIQPHPNLGHRDQAYTFTFHQMLLDLEKSGLTIFLKNTKWSWKEKLFFYRKKIYLSDGNQNTLRFAVVDLSAMEVQLYAKNIPVSVICHRNIKNLFIPKKMEKDYRFDFNEYNLAINVNSYSDLVHFDTHKLEYFIGYHQEDLKHLNFADRIRWLCLYCTELKQIMVKQRIEQY